MRGALDKNVYDGLRLKSVPPTRMSIDAHTTEEWRKMGFFSVNNSSQPEQNILLEALRIRREKPDYKMLVSIENSLLCPKSIEQTRILGIKNPELGMPFGFPPLNDKEFSQIENWISKKSPVPTPTISQTLSQRRKNQLNSINDWEIFFNRETQEQKLVSRYIYEHIFLAHLYFDEDPKSFFRLVRSRTACAKNVEEISTRRPNDEPNQKFYYCFQPIEPPFMLKTHMPLELSSELLKSWKNLFFESLPWKVTELPTYSPEVAQNPFVTFAEIPAKIRYQFLLKNAHFFVNTFIKGPVCNGTNAVNSIQEQFYVFFLSPETDPMSDPDHQKKAEKLLTLPGSFGSDVEVAGVPSLAKEITNLRESYRKLRLSWLQANKPLGLGISDVWDGDKKNSNAVLTVFRHNDNAVVVKGALGNLPKTVFLLDYSLFERLVYNLVVNFDVFGNVGHQLLTRVYMDFIRMEAEENFLLLVSPENRQMYRNSWYQGFFTEAKMKYIFPEISKGEPSRVQFKPGGHQKSQVLEQILESMSDTVRGEADLLNWRSFNPPGMKKKSLSSTENELKRVASIRSQKGLTFARFFPETAYLMIKTHDQVKEVYSIIHNREFENISWIFAESLRRAPEEDTLTLAKGFLIPYPEMIFSVEETQLKNFVDDLRQVKTEENYNSFEKKYGLLATQPDFWKGWDRLHDFFEARTQDQPDFSHIDLTRYRR